MRKPNNPDAYSDLARLVEGCYSILQALEMRGTRWGRSYHTYRPSLTKYGPYQWLWDSGWHMITWSWRRPENAIADLRTLLSFQKADGFIPELIFWRQNRLLSRLGRPFSPYSHAEFTDLTQMPILAYSLRAIWRATRDKSLLEEFVPQVARFLDWWQTRDPDQDGLISLIHPWESGLDASPSFDPAFNLSHARFASLYPHFWSLLCRYRRSRWNAAEILRREWFNFEDVGVCSVYADGWSVLSSLAEEYDRDLARRCRAKGRRFQDAILRKCWDEERGQFVSYFHHHGTETASRVETIQTLLPILLDDLPAHILSKLLAKILDPLKFGQPYPLSTVARSEPSFNPGQSRLLWRGPFWPAANWLVIEGLLKHGFRAEAGTILDRWTELCLQNGIWEYYNPLTGKGLGQKGLGMSTIIVDLLRRFGRV